MMSSKTVRFAVIASFLVLILQGSCKDNVTTPELGSKPVIWVNTFQVSFVASETGTDPENQILQVKNIGVGTLNYTIEDDANFYAVDWLSVDPPTGVSSGQINEHAIVIQKTGLSARTNEYTAKISVKSVEGYNSPQQVDVSLKLIQQEPAEIKVSNTQLSFTGQEGGANPASKSFTIENNGEATLNYVLSTDAAWLSASPTTGSIPQGGNKAHNASVNISGLKAGSYSGTITVADPNAKNNPQTITVSLTVSQEAPPRIGVSPTSLSFSAEVGSSNPSSKNIAISNSGDGTLNYQITWDAPWLNVNPNSGSTAGPARNHAVSCDIGGLGEGTYRGTITISDPNATNSPRTVAVTLRLTTTAPPANDNEIYLSVSPPSGDTGTPVTVTINIKGNTSPIGSFGLDLTFPSDMFQYISYSRGTLTGSFASVAANSPSPGLVKIGGFGGTTSVPAGSTGSLIVIRLNVTCNTCVDGRRERICMEKLTDDISAMITAPACRNFTFDK
jgi:hypothetical protein